MTSIMNNLKNKEELSPYEKWQLEVYGDIIQESVINPIFYYPEENEDSSFEYKLNNLNNEIFKD